MQKKKCMETQDSKVREGSAAAQVTAADEANFLIAPLVPLAKFNP